MTIHELLDTHYGADGDTVLSRMLEGNVDLDERVGPVLETPLHVATRRYRLNAVRQLVAAGANIEAKTAGGKTAYVHAVRRRFSEIADYLATIGASQELTAADGLAVALVEGNYERARSILSEHPGSARTGNPEEDRILADVAGRNEAEPVNILLDADADLEATGLDTGTALHQACWFGQPRNAELLIAAGAPLDIFDSVHQSSPLGWAVHGCRYSGGASERQERYVALVRMLLDAGSSLYYPGDSGDSYKKRLLADATEGVAPLIRGAVAN